MNRTLLVLLVTLALVVTVAPVASAEVPESCHDDPHSTDCLTQQVLCTLKHPTGFTHACFGTIGPPP